MISKSKILIFIIIVIVLLGLSLYFFYNPSDSEIFPKCPFYSATGIYCPGCGSQRAAHKILNVDFLQGLQHNWLLLLVFLVLGFQGIVWGLSKFSIEVKNNILHRPFVTYAILVIVILFWILRNINVYPFSLLAP